MKPEDQEMMEVSQHLTSSPQDDTRTRVPRAEHAQNRCWQDFTQSLYNFCGLVDEEQESADKWHARLEDLKTDRVIGHGKKVYSDEPDGVERARCSSREPISLSVPSKRSHRITISEAKQSGLFSTAIEGFKDLLDKKPKKSKRKPQLRSRSFTPASIREFSQPRPYSDYENVSDNKRHQYDQRFYRTLNDSFFLEPVGTSIIYRRRTRSQQYAATEDNGLQFYAADDDELDSGSSPTRWVESGDWTLRTHRAYGQENRIKPESLGFEAGLDTGFDDDVDMRDYQQYQRRDRSIEEPIKNLEFNADRRRVNQSWFGQLLDQGILSRLFEFKLSSKAKMHKHRPLFSIWMTFVQVLIFIVSVSVYGIAPIGFDEVIVSKEIIQPNLALKLESYREKANLWIGPRQADLITLGAKFSPCMRRDMNVFTAIRNDRVVENKTACCIYNDGSGCVQSLDSHCSDTLATWKKWTPKAPSVHDRRVSGSVCGQDPKFCKKPPSVAPFVWPDDITRWPVCEDKLESKSKLEEDRHAVCDVVGRPCCMGIQGECIITTREHCNFYRGHFHEEASLCAQVNCMMDICGMLPFGNPQFPDQFYRLWTCLFLHAGLIHVLITVAFNLLVMVSIEQTVGWIRVVVIYMGSGVCGSLASAIFVPYHVEAGAAGSQFGLLATQLVLVILFTAQPWKAAWKILLLLLILLIIGLLPMVDNYAHSFGFVFGFLISFAMLPFARVKSDKISLRNQRAIAMVGCTVLALGLAVILIIFFYVAPVYECPGCHYFNCIPFTPTFCETMEVKIRGVSSL